jgi:hypothetical protein
VFGGRTRIRTEGAVLLDTSVVRTSELYLCLRVEFARYRHYLRFGREAEGESRKGSEPLSTTVRPGRPTNNHQVLPVGTGRLLEAS